MDVMKWDCINRMLWEGRTKLFGLYEAKLVNEDGQ